MSPALAGGFSTTAPPGKPLPKVFLKVKEFNNCSFFKGNPSLEKPANVKETVFKGPQGLYVGHLCVPAHTLLSQHITGRVHALTNAKG